MKVLFLTNVPAPYRVDFFNELGKLCDLTVIFERLQAADRDKLWKSNSIQSYKQIILDGIKIKNEGALSLEILRYLSNDKFDIIVVGGYSTPSALLAITAMKLKHVKYVLNADGGIIKNDKNTVNQLKRFFIGGAVAWLSTGTLTSKYFEHYGANPDQIYNYPFTSLLSKDILSETVDPTSKEKLKKDLGLKGGKVVLSIGQFIHRKGFDLLLKSWAQLDDSASLYIIGGTPTEEYLDIIEKENLKNVFFIPFMNKEVLKKYYLAADLFVLPTREDIWGLVINEALAFGLPVVTTEKCVAGLELIENGKQGYLVPIDDIVSLSEAIKRILDDNNLRQHMSRNSLEKISDYTIENMAGIHLKIFENFLEKSII